MKVQAFSTGKPHLGLNLPRNNVVRLTDCLAMTIVVDWDVKPQNKFTHKGEKFGYLILKRRGGVRGGGVPIWGYSSP